MRFVLVASLVGALVGCGGNVDPTKNRGAVPTTPPGYPAGPYGYAVNSIIENIQFVAKTDPGGATGTAAYPDLQPQTISLNDLHMDSSVGYVLITGAAGWCGPCREEAREMASTLAKTWEPKGVRFVTALIQGFDEANQTPATVSDIDMWQAVTKEHITIGIDPNDYLHQFSAEIASFPLNILVRTYDMLILYQQLGLDSNNPSLDPVLQQYVTN